MKKDKNKALKPVKAKEKISKRVSPVFLGFVLGALTVVVVDALIIGFLLGKCTSKPKVKGKK